MNFFSDTIQKRTALEAYERHDYLTFYNAIYGLELSEEEEIMFKHAQVVLKVERRLTLYEKYLKERSYLKALDELIQAVANYDDMYGLAQECGATTEVASLYARIWLLLEDGYGLTPEDARAIALCDSNVEYTRYLTAIIAGEHLSFDGDFHMPETNRQDVLPEEDDLPNPGFSK